MGFANVRGASLWGSSLMFGRVLGRVHAYVSKGPTVELVPSAMVGVDTHLQAKKARSA